MCEIKFLGTSNINVDVFLSVAFPFLYIKLELFYMNSGVTTTFKLLSETKKRLANQERF